MVLGYLPFKLEKRVRFPLALPNNASDCLSERQAADNRPQRGSTPRRGTNFMKSFILSLALSASAAFAGDFVPLKKDSISPFGAANLCEKYAWACKSTEGTISDIKIIEKVNSQVNKARPIEDKDQYGVNEYWSLLSKKGGDCEDYALSKMKKLIELGFDANTLLMAVVLDKNKQPHAVLIWRSDKGDFVLDNITNSIRKWNQTNYYFIAVQNPENKSKWKFVME